MQDVFTFDAKNWFWVVGGEETRAWSSAASSYVDEWPSERATRIESEASLNDVLRTHGLTLPAPTQDDYAVAIQAHVDATARAPRNGRPGYNGPVTLASYVASTVPIWADEAQTFVAWRDAVWLYAYGELGAVQNGQRAMPTVPELIDELPKIEWPE